MQEPVLANLSGYTVLVRTPEGTHVNLRAGAAVAGPGFEPYIDSRTLIRVAPDFAGPIVYETPAEVVAAPPSAAPAAPAVPVTDSAIEVEPEEGVSVLSEILGGLSEPEDTPMLTPPSVTHTEAAATPESSALALKYGGTTFTVPGAGAIQTMPKSELRYLSERLGFRADGSRGQLVSRLLPMAGKSITPKR